MNRVSEHSRAVQESAELLRSRAGQSRFEPKATERLRELIAKVHEGIRAGHLQVPGGAATLWPDITELMSSRDQQALSELLGSVEPVEAVEVPSTVFAVHSALQRFEGDRALLGEVLEIFLEHVPLLLARMDHSATEGDTGALVGIAHELRGAAANVGAESLRAVSERLEHDLRADSNRSAGGEIDVLRQELEKLRVEVAAFLGGGLGA